MLEIKRFIIKPSNKLFGGIVVKKDTVINEKNEDGSVVQKLKNLKLTTIIKREHGDQYKSYEESKMVQEVPEDTILIWNETLGFVIPNVSVCSIEEGIEAVKEIKEIVDLADNKGE